MDVLGHHKALIWILLRCRLRQIHWQLALRKLLALRKIIISLLALWLSAEIKLVLLLWSHIQYVVIFARCHFDRASSSSWNSQKFWPILKNALMLLGWTPDSRRLIVNNLSNCSSSHLHIVCVPFLIVAHQCWFVHCGSISHLGQSCVQICIRVKERSVGTAARRILRNCSFSEIYWHLLNSSWFVISCSQQVLSVTGLLLADKIWTSTLCTAIIWIVGCRSLQAWIKATN